MMKVVIVGGVAGGATAASRIRRLNEQAEIIIFERSNYVSYANCGLPYYIGDEIKDKNKLTLATPESLWSRYRIDVRVKHEVIDIDSINKHVVVRDLENDNVFIESYDKLLLSPGAKPITLSYLDKQLKNVFTLRTVEDTFKIKEYINFSNPKSAAIVGGGFIGIEMAENLCSLGIDVTIIQKDNQLLKVVDRDIVSFIHHHIRSNNVNILLNSDVKGLYNINDSVCVKLENKELEFDLVVLSIGVIPDNSLALKTGIKLSDTGAIKVNSRMQTSDENIYAVGDAVEVLHRVLNKDMLVPLAGPANKEARVAADNICGVDNEYKGTLGTNVIKVFDMSVATTGLNEKVLQNSNIEYEKVFLSPTSHATYYPGATVMSLKVLYEKKTLRILGAQSVGYDGVDKRIDVIATLMFAGGNALMLKDLDLSYAPPYSSAKDPVNMAGFIIDNIEKNLVKQFYFEDIDFLRERKDVVLLDTRTLSEYKHGHAEGFMHIPLDNLRENLDLLDKNKKIYVMCQSGLRSYLAVRILLENGFNAFNFSGGYRLYNSINTDK